MNPLKLNFIAILLLLSGCATQSLTKNGQAWEDLRKSETFKKEKSIYDSRLGDKSFCWDVGLDDFLKSDSPKPNEKCIYPASKLVVEKDDGVNTLKQNFKQLKILQVSSNGFVIKSSDFRNDQVIFIYKTDESDLVDGSIFDETQNFTLYEYSGPFSYSTLVGSKTVYSFRKVNKKLTEARRDIKYYDPLRDFLIENQIWNSLGELPKN